MPSPPTPPGSIGFGGECGQRGVITGKHTAQPPGCPRAAFTQVARESPKRRLVVRLGMGLEVVAGCVGGLGQIAAPAAGHAGDFLAEASLDGDDMRRAEDAELQCAAVGVGQLVGGQWPRRGCVQHESKQCP